MLQTPSLVIYALYYRTESKGLDQKARRSLLICTRLLFILNLTLIMGETGSISDAVASGGKCEIYGLCTFYLPRNKLAS